MSARGQTDRHIRARICTGCFAVGNVMSLLASQTNARAPKFKAVRRAFSSDCLLFAPICQLRRRVSPTMRAARTKQLEKQLLSPKRHDDFDEGYPKQILSYIKSNKHV
eukprot:852502-Pyramimonas_sp.AAC.1